MVQSVGSIKIPLIALRFSILGFLSSDVLFVAGVFVFSGHLVPTVVWKAPKLSLVLELGSEIM